MYRQQKLSEVVLKYVVPFSYEDSFENTCEKLDSRDSIYIRKQRSLAESDLYEYVQEEFLCNKEDKAGLTKKYGCTWEVQGQEREFRYYVKGIKKTLEEVMAAASYVPETEYKQGKEGAVARRIFVDNPFLSKEEISSAMADLYGDIEKVDARELALVETYYGDRLSLLSSKLEDRIASEQDEVLFAKAFYDYLDSGKENANRSLAKYMARGDKNQKESGDKRKLFVSLMEELGKDWQGETLEKVRAIRKTLVDQGLKFTLCGTELCIFRNRIGFLIYELSLEDACKAGCDAATLVAFQNQIKELNRNDAATAWELTSSGQLVPFSFGQWAADLMGMELNPNFFAPRVSASDTMFRNSDKAVCRIFGSSYVKKDPDSKVADGNGENHYEVPDKAILFTYCAIEDEANRISEEAREELQFHVNNGYSEKYLYSRRIGDLFKYPYANVTWYASHEGASYFAWFKEEMRETFTNTIKNKVSQDYFTLFIKTIFQSYSMLHYAQQIQNLSLNGEEGEKKYTLDPRISDLYKEINLYLMKNMASSVSHIHYQSEFYMYLKNQLNVEADIQSVTSGLESIRQLQAEEAAKLREEEKELQRKKEEEEEKKAEEIREAKEKADDRRTAKIETITSFLSVLAIISALTDGYAFILYFAPNACEDGESFLSVIQNHPGVWGGSVILFVVLGILFFLTLGACLVSAYHAFSKDKSDKKESDK